MSIRLFPKSRFRAVTIHLVGVPRLPSSKIVLTLAHLLPRLFPSFHHRRPFLSTEFIHCGPVHVMIILEINITAMRFQKLRGRNQVAKILVKLELFASGRVDKRVDELEEAPDDPRD